MLLSKRVQILVFVLDDKGTFEPIGEINQFDSLIWSDSFNGFASFELWAPVTNENSELLKTGHVLWCGGDNAAMIEIVKTSVDDKGTMTYNVKGRTLEMLLTTRIIWNTYNAVNKHPSTVMYEIVDQNCINPADINRKIPFLECAEDTFIGEKITVQRTGGEVYDACVEVASNADIGFSIVFKPREQKLVFTVVEGVDRTVNQTVNDPVEFSTDLSDILSSSYYTNNQDDKSVALVMGESSGFNSGGASGFDFDAAFKDTLEKTIFRVGQYWISGDPTEPSVILGFGTWEQIKDRVLIGAGGKYAVGETGGEKEVTLTISQMPEHDHNDGTDGSDGVSAGSGQSSAIVYWNASSGRPTTKTGGSQPHNNMPPYLATYIWLRIA